MSDSLIGSILGKITGAVTGAGNESVVSTVGGDDSFVKILGGGCSKCQMLEDIVLKYIADMKISGVSVGHVKDFEKIAGYGVSSTPALVIGGKVVFAGGNFDADQIKSILQKELLSKAAGAILGGKL